MKGGGAYLLAVLVSLSLPASASQYAIDWQDIFPMCASKNTQDLQGDLRCVGEFMVPNFHAGLVFNLMIKSVTAFFMVDGVISFGEKLSTDPLSALSGLLNWLWSWISGAALFHILDGITSWAAGFLTPLIVILGLVAFEIIKAYLILGALYLMMVYTLQEINLAGMTPVFSVGLVLAFLVVMVFSSLYFMTLDMGGFADVPLFKW